MGVGGRECSSLAPCRTTGCPGLSCGVSGGEDSTTGGDWPGPDPGLLPPRHDLVPRH